MSEAKHAPKFSVGQVVMFDREGKRSLPVVVLEVMEDGAAYFYRIDQKNLLHEPMLRPLTTREKGKVSAPKPLDMSLVTTREMVVLRQAAVYSIAAVEAAAEDSARFDWIQEHPEEADAAMSTWESVRDAIDAARKECP